MAIVNPKSAHVTLMGQVVGPTVGVNSNNSLLTRAQQYRPAKPIMGQMPGYSSKNNNRPF